MHLFSGVDRKVGEVIIEDKSVVAQVQRMVCPGFLS